MKGLPGRKAPCPHDRATRPYFACPRRSQRQRPCRRVTRWHRLRQRLIESIQKVKPWHILGKRINSHTPHTARGSVVSSPKPTPTFGSDCASPSPHVRVHRCLPFVAQILNPDNAHPVGPG